MRSEEGVVRSRDEKMESRVGLVDANGMAIMDGDIGFVWESDPRIFRALGERVSRWEFGPKVRFRLLFKQVASVDAPCHRETGPIEIDPGQPVQGNFHSPLTTTIACKGRGRG